MGSRINLTNLYLREYAEAGKKLTMKFSPTRRECGTARRIAATLTDVLDVIHFCITMSAKTSIRDLRNHFPKVRHLLETQGEVLLTEKGQPRYRLTLYSPANEGMAPPVDYWARLNAYQPKTLTKAQSRALHDENRGDR